MTAFRKGRLQGLSCLKGNFHEQFLGGWAGAIPPGYPAHAIPTGSTVPTLLNVQLMKGEKVFGRWVHKFALCSVTQDRGNPDELRAGTIEKCGLRMEISYVRGRGYPRF